MSFSWFVDAVAEFAIAFNGVFWHDTWAVVVPPLPTPIDLLYVPSPDFKALVVGLTFGKVLVLDHRLGEWREPTPDEYIELSKVGVYHRCGEWMEWHWDPAVASLGIGGRFVYPQLGFVSRSNPYELRLVNRSSLTVFMDVTFWVIRFPNEVEVMGRRYDIEELFKAYMKSRIANQLGFRAQPLT